MTDRLAEKDKEHLETLIRSLASNMQSVAILLHKRGQEDKAKELNKFATKIHSWYRVCDCIYGDGACPEHGE